MQNAKISSVMAHNRRIFPCIAALLLVCMIPSPAHALFGGSKKREEKAGALLFRDKGCAHCHGIAGVGGKKGPTLTNIRNDKTWTPAHMTDQILNGGKKMPSFSDSLTDQELAQIIAYLRARHKPAPPPGEVPPTNEAQ